MKLVFLIVMLISSVSFCGYFGGGGVTDHGALTGLGDDDHTQYLLIDGTRSMTGNITKAGALSLESNGNANQLRLNTNSSLTIDGITFGRNSAPSSSLVISTLSLSTLTGGFNTFVGVSAGLNSTSTQQSTAVGTSSLSLLTSGNFNTAFGKSAGSKITTGTNNTFVGSNAGTNILSSSSGNVIIGSAAAQAASNSATTDAVVIGYLTNQFNGGFPVSLSRSVIIGASAADKASLPNSVILGEGAGFNNSFPIDGDALILIGRDAWPSSSTATNEAAFGSIGYPVNNIYFGEGGASPSPSAVTIHNTDAFGSNISGANLAVAAGRGTGTGVGGSLLFQTASAGGAGSTLNTLVTRMEVTEAGDILASGDLAFTSNGLGPILVAPDAGCWRVTVDNAGALSTSSVTCP